MLTNAAPHLGCDKLWKRPSGLRGAIGLYPLLSNFALGITWTEIENPWEKYILSWRYLQNTYLAGNICKRVRIKLFTRNFLREHLDKKMPWGEQLLTSIALGQNYLAVGLLNSR